MFDFVFRMFASGDAVVVACESPSAAKLLGDEPPTSGQGVTCIYFAAKQPPIKEPILVLNGDGRGRSTTCAFQVR